MDAPHVSVARIAPQKTPLKLSLEVPGDKSVSHRALMLGSLCREKTRIHGLLDAEDTRATLCALQALGAKFKAIESGVLEVAGPLLPGADPLEAPITLDCGNSGTTMRLLCGLVAGLNRPAKLIGDASLSQRPMRRVVAPLQAMGAEIQGRESGNFAPLRLGYHGGLRGVEHTLEIASGQVKGALLLASLFARGTTTLRGALSGRDHTERMLLHFGAKLELEKNCIRASGLQKLWGRDVFIPGDISAASFWLAAAAIVPGSSVTFDRVGLNPSRLGFVRLLQKMGANLYLHEDGASSLQQEPHGSLSLTQTPLVGVDLPPADVPALIDELVLVAVVATQAHGETRICGAEELRHKETDRISAICAGLRKMGARITERRDGLHVLGPTPLRGARVQSFGDHRIAMALAIAALVADQETFIEGSDAVAISYPNFFKQLHTLRLD